MWLLDVEVTGGTRPGSPLNVWWELRCQGDVEVARSLTVLHLQQPPQPRSCTERRQAVRLWSSRRARSPVPTWEQSQSRTVKEDPLDQKPPLSRQRGLIPTAEPHHCCGPALCLPSPLPFSE